MSLFGWVELHAELLTMHADSEDEQWEEEPLPEERCTCVFCDVVCPSCTRALKHCALEHGLDLEGYRRSRGKTRGNSVATRWHHPNGQWRLWRMFHCRLECDYVVFGYILFRLGLPRLGEVGQLRSRRGERLRHCVLKFQSCVVWTDWQTNQNQTFTNRRT